jgi:predicted dehydrogenase
MKTQASNKSNLKRREFVKSVAAASLTTALMPWPSLSAAENQGKIVLAFVGCAHIHTPSFVSLLKGRPDVEVKYVWDHDAERANKRAGELKARVVSNANEIWSDSTVKGVVICSETNRHLDLVQAAAKAGKHMFVEKPLGITAKDSVAMADAIEKAGLIFTTGYFMRCDPKHLFLKKEIAAGHLGKITRANGSNCHSGSLGGWFDTEWRWMADPKIAGVGAFGDLGTHMLDIMMWLLGDVESVTAQVRVVTGRYNDCDETGEALIKFKSGVLGNLAAGWVDVADPVTLLISGTEGHASIINGQLFYASKQVEGADGKKPWTALPEASPAPMHMFVDTIAGKPNQPLVTPREAAARVSVMEAMYQGARENKWVNPI